MREARMDDTPIILENHPTDSRIKMQSVFQTLSARMGTGGVMFR